MISIQEAIGYVEQYVRVEILHERNFSVEVDALLTASLAGLIPSVQVASGCTKGVFIFTDADFVIKVPYRGYKDPFTNSESASGWDYCEREEELYIAAEKFGVSQFLARTWRVGEINNHPVYAQERITEIGHFYVWDDIYYAAPQKVVNQADKFSQSPINDKTGFFPTVLVPMISAYGYRACQKFARFCKQMNVGTDWHYGNFGMTFDGNIMFCDYSGYRG